MFAAVTRGASLLAMVRHGTACAEVGVWKGDFAANILRVVRPSRLHLIDPWVFVTDTGYEHARYGGASARGQADMDDLYESVVRRFAKPVAEGIVEIHRRRSDHAAAILEDGFLD